MPNQEQLLSDLDASTHALTAALLSIPEDRFQVPPAENAWPPAAIAEHILMLETLVNRHFSKAHFTERPHDSKVEGVKMGLESTERKFVSPDFLHPSAELKDVQTLVSGLEEQRDHLQQHIRNFDLSETLDMKHPVIGSMTRWEWVHFIINHAARHVRQLQAMAS